MDAQYGNAGLYAAEIGAGDFIVKGRDGDPNVEFAWRLSATRKGCLMANKSLATQLTARRVAALLMVGALVAAVVFVSVATPASVIANPPNLQLASTGAWPPPVPSALMLTVRETAGVARSNEVVRSGVPLPRSLKIRNTNSLAIINASGTAVPAEFRVLARWHAGRNDDVPIQWLLVTFPATVSANSSATYRLVTDGSVANPAPATPLSLTQSGGQITVNTGAAIFRLGANAGALFDEVRLANNTQLISSSVLTATVNNANTTLSATRRISVEHAGPLSAVVVVEGTYDMPSVGDPNPPAFRGGLSSLQRYIFTAGSPTAMVRHTVNWEGDLCPGNGYDLTCNGTVNGLRVTRIRDALTLNLGSPLSAMAIGNFAATAVQGNVGTGQSAWVRQQLRANRTNPLAFEVDVAGATASGIKADGGLLSVSGGAGAVAIALNHMHRYEPQALRLLADGRLAIDIADDRAWIGQRQGLFATLAVSALAANPTRSDLDRLLWAPLNHPLHAWPEAAWFAASEAVDEFPVGPLPGNLASYDTIVASVLTSTLQNIDAKGLAGLMTFGVYPRFWAYFLYSDEIDCGPDNDPTPGETWDNPYWCALWTDYHNTVAAAPIWAMRTAQVDWLDEIAFPGALRMLHTQIQQCAPSDGFFYCGQSPAGYGGYRLDFNSSHAYFDNLFLYYWLTGDYTVVELLKRGASSMRAYLCTRRPAQSCLPDDPPQDDYAQLTGRVASQWFAVFRFVGLASDDAGYLDDYTSGLARAVTQYYVEAEQSGTRYGFWISCPIDRNQRCPFARSGPESTDQLWMVSLYDMNMLYRLQRDTSDAPIGNPAIPPSQVIAAWARTLTRFGATTAGDGTASGTWPNALYFTWSGNRIGGTLVSVTANQSGGDPNLYNTGKATLTAVLVRAGQQSGNASVTQMGSDMTLFALNAAQNEITPLSKLQGEYLSRLHAAVARLAAASAPGGTPTPTSTPTNTATPTATPTSAPLYMPLVRKESSASIPMTIATSTASATATPTATPTGSATPTPTAILRSAINCAFGFLCQRISK